MLEVERHGSTSGEPLLLIRGLGTQLIYWPPPMIAGLVRRGFHVIVYDNRDVGLSQKFDHLGLPVEDAAPPYSLADMADDAAALLTVLGLDTAHVFGMSMGGMVLQHLLLRHADRVRSATIVMSSSGDSLLPSRSKEVDAAMRPVAGQHLSREQAIEDALVGDGLWGSPGFPFDPDARRALHAQAYDRCYHPDGVARHRAATLGDDPRARLLGSIARPVQIIHGTDDAIFTVEHGRDLANRIPGAQLLEIEGMGHDLEGGLSEIIAEAMGAFVLGARAPISSHRGNVEP